MTDNLLNYIVIGVTSLLAIFSFVMWIEKMIKIIVWNYILTWICLAAGESITLLVNILNQTPEAKTLWILHAKLANFFTMGQTTFVLILYAALLVVIYLKSKLYIRLPADPNVQKSLYIILVPMTVISFVLTLQIALMGIKVLDVSQLTSVVKGLAGNNYAYKFIAFTPLWILLHGIITIIITTELKVWLKKDPKMDLSSL